MILSANYKKSGLTLVEVLVAAAVLAVTTIGMTQSMLILNRNAAVSRVRNLAKAAVLGKIQETAAVDYDISANPPVVPANLVVQNTSSTVNLGASNAEIGNLPATMTYTVADTGFNSVLTVKCRVNFTYLGRPQSYEIDTFRSPD